MNNLLEALWLFLPAAVANATPVITSRLLVLRGWSTPIDFGRTYRGQRILGKNKTWRGVVSGVVLAATCGYLQSKWQPIASLPTFMHVVFAAAIGFGALYGDAVESFFKRQRQVPSGHSWFPFDQLDYIFGGLLAGLPFGVLDLPGTVAIIAVYFGLHLITVYVGFKLGFRERPI